MEEYLDTNDPISIKFKGIEMRGINDNQVVLRSHPALEKHEIETLDGLPVKVYIQRGTKSAPLVTFHDIGTNYVSFLSFFNYPEMRVILDHFTVYHVCAPGHENPLSNMGNEDSDEERYELLSSNAEALNTSQSNGTKGEQKPRRSLEIYPTMAELAEIVGNIVDHFQIKYFTGFGMGAGANVLVRYGLDQPSRLLGLFLINPDDTTTGYYSWTRARWSDIPYLKTGVLTDWIQNWLLDHWFGSGTERNLDLEQSYLQLLGELNPVAVAGYIDSYMNRTALNMTRPISNLDTAFTLKVDSFLVAGEMAPDLCRAMVDMNGNMDPSKTQFLSVPDATGAVMDEVPSKLAVLLLSYLRNLGMLVTFTPEKLQKVALDNQIKQAKAIHATETFQVNFESMDKC